MTHCGRRYWASTVGEALVELHRVGRLGCVQSKQCWFVWDKKLFLDPSVQKQSRSIPDTAAFFLPFHANIAVTSLFLLLSIYQQRRLALARQNLIQSLVLCLFMFISY